MPAGTPVRRNSQAFGENINADEMPNTSGTSAEASGIADAEGRTPTNSRAYKVRPTTVADEYEDGFNQYSRPVGEKAG